MILDQKQLMEKSPNYKLVKEIFLANPQLSTSENVRRKLEKSLEKSLELHEYKNLIEDYLYVAVCFEPKEAKERFIKIFFDLLCPTDNYLYLTVTNWALQFEGLHDVIVSDFEIPMWGSGLTDTKNKESLKKLLTGKPHIAKRLKQIYYHAISDQPFIVVGETGTGKELLCRAMHTISKRRLGLFREINCAAIQENLLESELFGHEKGAFTGAKDKHIGLFEQCDKGTLFLDELGRMPERLQLKLLKAVEEKEITPIGGRKPTSIDVRFIAAAQPRNLKDIVDDLRTRLGYPDIIEMPPLRERLNERDEVAGYILSNVLNNALKEMDINENVVISKDSKKILLSYEYLVGNYRELRNIMISAVNSMRSRPGNNKEITPEDLSVMEKLSKLNDIKPIPIHQTPTEDIKLKEIVPHANAIRATIIEKHLCRLLKDGKDIKSVFVAEGNPPNEYQNFLKTIRHITGKGIHELKRSLKH